MAKTLYLMRHGETLFNSQHRIQGWSDSPLTPRGIKQAQIAAHYFPDHQIKLESAYCSTSERASDTIELITKLPYKRLKGLREWNFGVFEAEHDYLYPVGHDTEFFASFGGESETQVQQRFNQTMLEIMHHDPAKTILVVSHGNSIRSFTHFWHKNKINPEQLILDNCCILKFTFEQNTFTFQNIYHCDFSNIS